MAGFVADLSSVIWWQMVVAVILIAISSTFFFRFPMVFLCGLFFPIAVLPVFLRPVSYVLPLTYGADVLHGAVNGTAQMPVALNLAILAGFCTVLFMVSLRNIQRKWIH